MTWFVDKLNVKQTHETELPKFGEKGFLTFDLLTGEFFEEAKVSAKGVQASYSTSLRIRCDGFTVSVEGNPSRFGRSENLMGLTSIEDCIAVYNRVLLTLGLPPFTTGKFHFLMGKENAKQKKIYTGAVITHIDVTKNHSVGPDNEYAFLRAIATLSLPNGKKPNLYPNGATVDWHTSRAGRGSSWDYSKIYIKAVDLLDKKKKNLKGSTTDDEEYYRHVYEHCVCAGIIREEHSFKNKKLQRYDLCYYGYVTLEMLVNHHTLTTLETLVQTLEVTTMDYVTIADQLINRKVVKSRQAANATANFCNMWLHGQPLHCTETGKRSRQFYEHKARLLMLGIDISVPFCPTRNVIPTIKNQRVIERMDYDVPAWYRKPNARANLALINCGQRAA